jgi:anti-sigma factor RsiW
MFRKHLSDTLAAFVDGQLSPAEATHAKAHLAQCDRCRGALDEYRFAASLMRGLPLVEAPSSIWTSIERESSSGARAVSPAGRSDAGGWGFGPVVGLPAMALAAMVILALGGVVLWQVNRPAPYDVVRLDVASGAGRVSIGEWIETDATSRARIKIGEIGTVDIAPNTRMQLVAAQAAEHRWHLARGSISAQILAPPRLFFVETPSSTVVDLGCAYTMEVDDAGVGQLRVTSGWASLEWDNVESLVPAGASCPTRPEVGPGTPAFDDASDRLRQALLEFDYSGGGSRAVDVVLAESRQRDTLTLWHLLSRVEADERPRIFDRMVALTPLPTGVTREKALALDAAALKLWREELAWTW